ncbi:MAG: hypothetical protein R3A51_23990, partial [Nannocystaceae bacterium]
MGKSRLTHEGIAALERSGHAPEVWSARADPVAVGSPLSLITQLLQSAAGIADGEPLALRQGRLRRYLARRVSRSRLDRLTTFLAELIRAPFPDDHSDALRVARQDPAIMSQQTRSAWTETIAAVSAFRPVILWIDDLQWGDLASVRFLDHVLDPAVGARVLLIAAGRPELFSRFPQLWTTRVIERVALTGLSLAEQRQFVRAALGDAAPPEPTLDALITRTEGNPLFLEELARAFAKGSFDQLPQTMVAIIQARLQALDFEARQLLRGASVFGKSFWVEGVAALRGEDEAPAGLREWIDELVAQELLVPVPGSRYPATSEFEFHNATVRDAAYRTLPDADARAAHCAVARWLTAVGETNAAVIAEHFLRGEAYAEATAWYATAADQAFERNEFDAVRELVRRGIEHAPPGEARGRLLLRRAEVLAVAGNHAEAAEAALAAVDELPKNSPRWYSATGEAAQACARIGDQARVRDIIAMLSDIEPAATGGVNFVGLVTAALPLASAGKIKTARELLARVIAVTSAMAEVDPSALGPMHSARALGAVAGGMLGSAFVNLEAAAIAFEEAGSVRYALEHFGGAGFFCLELGQLDRGEQILRRTLRRSAEVGL